MNNQELPTYSLIALVIVTLVSHRTEAKDTPINEIPHWDHFVEAGTLYGIDPLLLAAIGKVESNFEQTSLNTNKDGSEDYGVMQINRKIWEQELREHGIAWNQVERSVEMNIYVGAWVLAQKFNESGVGWLSVGSYNAGLAKRNEPYRRKYAQRVYLALLDLSEVASNWKTESTFANR